MNMYQVLIFLFTLFIAEISLEFVQFAQLLMEDVHFLENIGVYNCTTLATCLILCLSFNNCAYAGFNETAHQCYIHARNASTVEGMGRTCYVRSTNVAGFSNTSLMTGATAWQQSTYDALTADKAIDGNFNQDYSDGSCSRTSDRRSYWAMEFGIAGVVASVDLYLRADHPYRNTNFAVLISKTQEDVRNNIGMECGSYNGPAIITPPQKLSFKCPRPIYGKFLKVSREADVRLVLCEVVVHSF